MFGNTLVARLPRVCNLTISLMSESPCIDLSYPAVCKAIKSAKSIPFKSSILRPVPNAPSE